jgi:cobalt/nickel transport system permease protein
MHIPDGLLEARVLLPLGAATAGAVALSAARARSAMEERPGVLALTGVTGAFILAAQMVNIPVLPGVSGHLLGGVLAGVLVGPWCATLAMVAVFAFQAFVQQDGGVYALGANAFNMGVIATFLGTGLYRGLRAALERIAGARRAGVAGSTPRGAGLPVLAAAFVAALASVLLGALACFLEVAVSQPPYASGLFLGLMLGHHAVIGLLEGAITCAVIAYVARLRPDLLEPDAALEGGAAPRTWPLAAQFLIVALVVGLLLASYVEELGPPPDGFEAALEKAAPTPGRP